MNWPDSVRLITVAHGVGLGLLINRFTADMSERPDASSTLAAFGILFILGLGTGGYAIFAMAGKDKIPNAARNAAILSLVALATALALLLGILLYQAIA